MKIQFAVEQLAESLQMLLMYMNIHSAKKFLDTSKSPIFPEMFHIRSNKSISKEVGGCLLHFDTNLVRFG